MSKVIFLNGCGSAGKTSIARAIQYCSDEPWLRLSMDMFIDRMPSQYIAFGKKAPEGYYSFAFDQNDRGPAIKIENGPLGKQVFSAIPSIAKILADQGNNLVIDEVLLGDETLEKYVGSLKFHPVYFVGVLCDLQTMQERELLRGDRAIGLSNGQIDTIHAGKREYDLTVDTAHTSPFVLAKDILTFVKSTPEPQGFKRMETAP
jgi:chloramphenicol 3-O phosphotransferase